MKDWMQKFVFILSMLLFPAASMAALGGTPGGYYYSAPDTAATLISTISCQNFTQVFDADTNITYLVENCPSYSLVQQWPLPATGVSAGSYTGANITVGVDGRVTSASNGSAGTATFNYPSRTLNSCYQISATKDARFHYTVDVTTALSLTSGAQGTVTMTSYTNSACSTGAQVVTDGTAAQTGSLVIGLNVSQVISVAIDGDAKGGTWLKMTTANTVGTPTFSLRGAQAERINP